MITKQIPMTRVMIEDCILNSKLFRDAVIDTMTDTAIHNEVLRVMTETNGKYNKIAFIKAIREISEGNAREFARVFPHVFDSRIYYNSIQSCLGLADSKYLAEHYIKLHS